MTSPGPCMIGCGSRVSVGVNVSVGSGVSEGGIVGEWVGKRMGVTVGGGVAEGDGRGVQVGTRVGVEGSIKVSSPHAISIKTKTDMPMETLLIVIKAIPTVDELDLFSTRLLRADRCADRRSQ